MLSFLGLQPPLTSWGLLQEAQNIQSIAVYPWVFTSAIFIAAAILAFNFLGDGNARCGRSVHDARTVFHRPLHPYTVGLMRSIPQVGRGAPVRLAPIPGSVPDPFSVPAGCAFSPRCPGAKTAACQSAVALQEVEPAHHVRCTLYERYEEGG